ncbi:PQQ-binding-like beta-propeller repeat protein [Candidatus Pelagibacter bacterium]|nr:PQQ-binding-like beta-propeller repeat protein [Candidatus Pelagibacter bacterium]MDA8832005.1 PQQ-binding-like beta-propeller repeat protein [Candidatus Pelagibacter bacterium]MDA8835611.1 PQQ-binding-like beta-propeller repeat protein [Candidatus Pelagibacter bacterium]MDA9972878.1 PQQ-binding-like beta-propeller repeat protein [Candidatus Pelagibacter ubique]
MNKVLLSVLILLILNNCSASKKVGFWNKDDKNQQQIENNKTILTKQIRLEEEFNSNLYVKISNGKLNQNSLNDQNDTGELTYEGVLEKIGKYNFSKFNDFDFISPSPLFYNNNLVFYDNKGEITLYDENQKTLWKNNFYNKSEKKIKPRLNFALKDDILIVTDDVAKYYAINIDTGELLWIKTNIVPFNSNIKIKNDVFYVVDYKNILRSISIKDGSEIWNLKTEESLTKSNTQISIALDDKNIYFNNSIGDITAVDIKSGQLVWQLPTQNNNISQNAFQLSNSELVINENTIFFSNNKNEFYSIDSATGLINWKTEISSDLKPVVIGKLIITISEKGYLYIIDKKSGNIIRINDLYKNYKDKKRNQITPTGFFVALNKIYLTNSDGKLIIVNSNDGNILNVVKVSGGKILQPFINENNLFLISNGSIIKFN